MIQFIPIINLNNIQILTLQNYLTLGIHTIAYSLEALLIKPGFKILMQQTSLKNFVAWPHKILLMSNTQSISLKSPFDGSTINHSHQEIKELLLALKPDIHEIGNKNLSSHISAQPLTLAQDGKFITRSICDIRSIEYKTQFEPLQKTCACPTCKLNLTKAYLHHLWFEVPLLAQRYLAMHNITQALKAQLSTL